MPALPPVPQVLKAVVSFTMGVIPCVNVFHIRYSGAAPSPSDCTAIAQQVHSAWSQNFIPWILNTVHLQQTQISDLSSPTAGQGTYIQNIPGAINNAVFAPNSAAIVGSWKIANRYRGGKPRTYITGLAQNAMATPTTWNTTNVSNFQTAFSGFMLNINNMTAGTGQSPFVLGCVHYKLGHQALNPPRFDAFTGVLVSPPVRSQRGRMS